MTVEDCDVLIVGAGPVGMVLALMLNEQGVKVKIVERQRALYPLPRAVAFDHESRRLFGTVGLTEELEAIIDERVVQGGENGTNYVWRDADLKMVVDLHCEAPTRSGYPFGNNFNQPTLERLIEKKVLEKQIPLIRGYSISSIVQHPHRVEAVFEKFVRSGQKGCEGVVVDGMVNCAGTNRSASDGDSVDSSSPLRVQASYLIGCDGANSTVRRLQEISQTNLEFENDWLIVDLLLRDGYVPPRVAKIGAAQICDPNRPTTCIAGGKGRRRFEFMRTPGESHQELLKDETLWSLLEPYGFTPENVILERKVIYTFNARWANEFFKGRVALAGDALHLMPPFIGQGLNSGFRDAGALAWRLPLMLRGIAGPQQLLQSYQEERLNHIRLLTEYCITLGEVVCETNHEKSKALHAKLRAKPPGRRYDPPLGRPGTLTSQEEAGKLSLHRKINRGDEKKFFDKVHGYGWVLLNFGDKSFEGNLSGASREFFLDTLKGKVVNVSAADDFDGEYRDWFANDLAADHGVLIRPDFYVFGHAAAGEVNALVDELRSKVGSA